MDTRRDDTPGGDASNRLGGGGVPGDRGGEIDAYRGYLLAVAAKKIHPQWRGRLAASDLVQQTLAEAAMEWDRHGDRDSSDVLRWLRRILANNLCDGVRQLSAAKREVGREISVRKSVILGRVAAPRRDRPDHVAIEREQAALLDEAIEQLPRRYRRVILLRHRDNCSFAEIGADLGVSENAAQKIWSRAVDALRVRAKGR